MIRRTLGMVLLFSTFLYATGYAQSNKEKASNNAKQALLFEDKGKYQDAITLLLDAVKLDTDNINYPYELAIAYYSNTEYSKAQSTIEKILDRKDAFGTIYQVLGNTYDKLGKRELAIATYEKGLARFPNTSELHLELGNMNLVKKEYGKALDHYEKGILCNPAFSSNYFWAAKILCNSDDPVWGMIYAEIFLDLERNSPRTDEISRVMFETYKKCIRFPKDSTFAVNFTKKIPVNSVGVDELGKKNASFARGVYEPTIMLALLNEKAVDINSLCRVRKYFTESYFKTGNYQKYPNVVFDFQYRALKAGHIDAYNHWVLYKGDEQACNEWIKLNSKKWDDFMKWFPKNLLLLDTKYKFIRGQY